MNIMSCIGILLVVCGHENSNALTIGGFFPYYSYHLPLFMFISGYFYSTSAEKRPLTYIARKFCSTIVYYLFWLFAYALIAELFRFIIGDVFTIAPYLTLKSMVLDPLKSSRSVCGFIGSAWYLVALFNVLVINVCLRIILKKVKLCNEAMIFLISSVIGIAGLYIMNQNKYGWLAIRLFQTGYFFPFFQLGRLYKVHLEASDHLSNAKYFGTIFVVQILLFALYGKAPKALSSYMNGFEKPILDFMFGLTGIAFVLRISRILDPVIGQSKAVLYIGRNTRTIMSHHLFWYFILHLLLSFIVPFVDGIGEIDYAKMYQTVYYHFYPFGITGFNFAYVVLTIALPLLTLKLMQVCKAKVLKNRKLIPKVMDEAK